MAQMYTKEQIVKSEYCPQSGRLQIYVRSELGHNGQWKYFEHIQHLIPVEIQKVILSHRRLNVNEKEKQVLGTQQFNIPNATQSLQKSYRQKSISPAPTRTAYKPRTTQFVPRVTQVIQKQVQQPTNSKIEEEMAPKIYTPELSKQDTLSETTKTNYMTNLMNQIVDPNAFPLLDPGMQSQQREKSGIHQRELPQEVPCPSVLRQSIPVNTSRNSFPTQMEEEPIGILNLRPKTHQNQLLYPGYFGVDVVESVLRSDGQRVLIKWSPRLNGDVPEQSWERITEFKVYYPMCMIQRSYWTVPFEILMKQLL